MTAAPTYSAALTANDGVSPVLMAISKQLEVVSRQMKMVAPASAEAASVTGWQRLQGVLGSVSGAVKKVEGAFGGALAQASAFLPPLAALGGIGAVGGIFKLTHSVAESTDQFQRTADKIGIATSALAKYNFLALMTDTSTEEMAGAMTKFNVAVAKAADGSDKAAASLFQRLGISLKDARGNLRDLPSLMDDVMKAMRVNENPQVRSLIARTLFGRGGVSMIPLLTVSPADQAKIEERRNALRFVMPPEQKQALLDYDEAWKELDFSIGQVSKSIGAKLAPVLLPVVQSVTDWIAKNRELMATLATEKVANFAKAIEAVQWKQIASDVRGVMDWINGAAQAVGGWTNVLKGILAIRAVVWTAEVVAAFGTIGTAGVAAFKGITAAVLAADAAISGSLIGRIALAAGPAVVAAYALKPAATQTAEQEAEGFRAAGLPAPAGSQRADTAPALPDYRQAAIEQWKLTHPGQPIPAYLFQNPVMPQGIGLPELPAIAGDGRRDRSEVQVTVDFLNMPEGARAAVDSTGRIPPPRVNVGNAFGERRDR